MKKRWALVTAAMGAFLCLRILPTSAQEVVNANLTPAVFALNSYRAPVPLAAADLAGRIAAARVHDASTLDSGVVARPKLDIYAGFSYLNDGLLLTRLSSYGWNLQGTWNLSPHIGFTADFSGNNGSSKNVTLLLIAPVPQVSQDAYFFLFGPKVTARTEEFEVFGHFLVGAAHGRFDASAPGLGGIALPGFERDTNFALALGGGV